MPAKRKRRKRIRLNWGPILGLFLFAVLVLGVMFSPITGLAKARVEGARPEDQPQIEATLAVLRGIPYVMVNPRWAETNVQRIGAVEKASYSQNIFRRGLLTVKYRKAVAKVDGRVAMGMDATGFIYKTGEDLSALPTVVRPPEGKELYTALTSGWEPGKVAALAIKAAQIGDPRTIAISYNEDGAVCLNIGKGKVILGSCDDLDKKLEALRGLLAQQPEILSDVESLNLTSPTNPVKTYSKRHREEQ